MNTGLQDSGGEPDDLWLDQLLSGARPLQVEDDGFTERVLQRLAPRVGAQQALEALQRRRRSDARLAGFTLLGAVLGSAVAFGSGSWSDAEALMPALQALAALRLPSGAVLLPWLVSLGSAATLGLVLQREGASA